MQPETSILRDRDLSATGTSIASVQTSDGAIPWWPGGRVDPWNHVESAMGLDVCGRHEEAERAYFWLAETQRRDGAWASAYLDGMVIDPTLDANFSSYVAAGVWHHWRATRDARWLADMWPVVEDAVEFALELQRPDGTIAWARDAAYRPWPGALLTACSCIHLSLRCAIWIAETLGLERPDWELSAEMLGQAIATRPDSFEPKDLFAMDWYYPVLGGVLRNEQGRARLKNQWERFVVAELGARCIADRPWVTAAETCELVIALRAIGLNDAARTLFGWVQHLRTPDGAYWTGATFPDGRVWPRETTTWTAAAILLAADAMSANGPTAGFFTDVGERIGVGVSEPVADPL